MNTEQTKESYINLLKQIKEIIRNYHTALNNRENGNRAMYKAFDEIEKTLKEYDQGLL